MRRIDEDRRHPNTLSLELKKRLQCDFGPARTVRNLIGLSGRNVRGRGENGYIGYCTCIEA